MEPNPTQKNRALSIALPLVVVEPLIMLYVWQTALFGEESSGKMLLLLSTGVVIGVTALVVSVKKINRKEGKILHVITYILSILFTLPLLLYFLVTVRAILR
jgi:hypothetical protein